MKISRDPHLLSGAYALDALTPQEVVAMEAAMRTSEDLRSEVAELSDTAVLLGLSVTPVEPSSSLRASLLAAIEHTPQLEPLERDTESDLDEAEVPELAPVLRGPAHWYRRPVALVAGLAAAAALVFGAGVIVDHGLTPASTSDAATSSFERLAVVADLHHSQTVVQGGGTATVLWSPSLKSAAVVVSGTRAPAGKSLQLWRIANGTMTSLGLYHPADGENFQMLPAGLGSAESVGITIEPQGGSKTPTTTPIATVAVA